MYNDTVTLFQRSGDNWYPVIIHNVDFNADTGAILSRYGADARITAKLHIAYRPGPDGPDVGGMTFKLPKAWYVAAAPTKYISFKSGEDFDIVMYGEWTGGAVVDDTDYTDGFYNHLVNSRDGVFAVISCAVYSVIPHFEILLR